MKKIILVSLLGISFSLSHSQTVGLFFHNTGTEDGYVLFAPNSYTQTYLMDKCGKQVHSWNSVYRPGDAVYLLGNGNLLRTGNVNNLIFTSGGAGGIIELLDTNSAVLWSYLISDTMQCQHHDVYPLPNGNVLAIVWDRKNQAQAIAEGRNPSLVGANLWSEKIIEIQPTGSSTGIIVWQWNVWDHLVQEYDNSKPNYGVVSQHPELININFFTGMATQADWLHLNAIAYNTVLDQIMVSSHNLSELWIIDHSTTTAEAASHTGGAHSKGGDLLYRWGNPSAYNRGAAVDKKFFGQHNPHWIEPGLPDANNILVFNNGLNRPAGNYSDVEIISPPINSQGDYSITASLPYQPDSAYWKYTTPVPTNFYSSNISGAQRLANGNTLICEGTKGNFFEIDTNNVIVWKYVNPVNATGPIIQNTPITGNPVFRCTQVPFGHPGLSGYDLTPGNPIELNPLSYACSMITGTEEIISDENSISVYPNPFHFELTVALNSVLSIHPAAAEAQLKIFNGLGAVVYSSPISHPKSQIHLGNLTSGIYFYQIRSVNKIYSSGKIIAE